MMMKIPMKKKIIGIKVRDTGERAEDSGNALNAVTYDLQRRDRWRDSIHTIFC